MDESNEQLTCNKSELMDNQVVHFYRAEMNRMTVWRSRLDTTTHWAIILSTGLTSFVLGSSEVPHFVMLLGLAFITLFMSIEGRRYQHLHHSKWRLGLLEKNYFANQFSKTTSANEEWRDQLAGDLRRPHFTITWFVGVCLRLRRNYLVLAYFIYGVWLTKVYIHPVDPDSLTDFCHRLSLGQLLPWWLVAISATIFIVGFTIAAFTTKSEETLEHWTSIEHTKRFKRDSVSGDVGK